MSRTALVTGAAGFLGLHLCRALAAHGDRVHAVLRPGAEPWRAAALPDDTVFHRADLADWEALHGVFSEVTPDVVIHAAAHRHHSHEPLRRQVADDVLATAHVLQAAAETAVARLVCLDSSLVLRPDGGRLEEAAPWAPVGRRASCRAAATLLVRQARREGMPLTLVRPFHVYGPWEPPARLVGRALLAATEGLPLPLTASETRLDPVFAADVAAACLAVADAPPLAAAEVAAGGLDEVNVAGGVPHSPRQVVAAVERVVGARIDVRPGAHPAGAHDGVHRVADPTRLERRFGLRAATDLDTGLQRTLDWMGSGAPGVETWRQRCLDSLREAE